MKCEMHSSEDAEKMLLEAADYSDNFLYEKAVPLLKNLLEYHTDTIEEWSISLHLGESYFYLNKYKDCQKYLRRCLKLLPDDEKISTPYLLCYQYLGFSYYEQSQYGKALSNLDKISDVLSIYEDEERYSDLYLYYLNKGRTLIYLRKFSEAVLDFENAYKANYKEAQITDDYESSYGESLVNLELSRAHTYLHDYTNVAKYIEKIKIDDLNDCYNECYNYIKTRYYSYSKQYKKAIEMYHRIKHDTEDKIYSNDLRYFMGYIYYHMNKFTEAGNYFSKVKLGYLWEEQIIKEFKLYCLKIKG